MTIQKQYYNYKMQEIKISTDKRTHFIDITSKVEKIVSDSGVKEGACIVYCPHTTAAITINESADPDVVRDIKNILHFLIPREKGYKHSEGNSAAHIKSSIIGCSETIIIKGGKLVLGTWQGIFFCEFDGPRDRKAYVEITEK